MSFSQFLWQLPGILVTCVFVFVWWRDRKFSEAVVRELRDELKRTLDEATAMREKEREAHVLELAELRKSMEKSNDAEMILAHAEKIVALRKAHQDEIENKAADFRFKLDEQRLAFEKEKGSSIRAARELERMECESRLKAFSVEVSPYVSVEEKDDIWRKSLVVKSGFQYQLMVHGVPAFEPHQTVIESKTHTGQSKNVDALVAAAIEVAKGLARAKVDPLGSLVTMGAPIKQVIGKATNKT